MFRILALIFILLVVIFSGTRTMSSTSLISHCALNTFLTQNTQQSGLEMTKLF